VLTAAGKMSLELLRKRVHGQWWSPQFRRQAVPDRHKTKFIKYWFYHSQLQNFLIAPRSPVLHSSKDGIMCGCC